MKGNQTLPHTSSRPRKQRSAPVAPGHSLGVRGSLGWRELSLGFVPEKACLQTFSPVTFKRVEWMTQLQSRRRARQQMAASNEKTLKERLVTLCLTLLSMWPPSSEQAAETATVSNPKSWQKPLPAKPRRKGLCF